jgi:hypothetical protein
VIRLNEHKSSIDVEEKTIELKTLLKKYYVDIIRNDVDFSNNIEMFSTPGKNSYPI